MKEHTEVTKRLRVQEKFPLKFVSSDGHST